MKAWALLARQLETAAHKDMKHVEEAMDATHRVMELDLFNADAMETMAKLVRCELERRLEKAPLSDEADNDDLVERLSTLDPINDQFELNRLLVRCIRLLFQMQRFRNVPLAVGIEKKITDTEAKIYNAMATIFAKTHHIRMSISCEFRSIHLLNQLDQPVPTPQRK